MIINSKKKIEKVCFFRLITSVYIRKFVSLSIENHLNKSFMTPTKETLKGAQTVKLLPSPKTEKQTEAEQKKDILAQIEKFKPEPPRTAEDRITSIKQFEALSERYKLLKEKDNDLKLFIAGNDKTNAKITFTNGQDFKFDIRNSNVIEKLNKAAQEELSILLKEAENEVLTFQI